ncbi:MAG: aminopeptidase P family protein, partial [Armatimonadetes bacterium]|nr:aminopeptidase P family protein [Candidatus Hippobium faecium]
MKERILKLLDSLETEGIIITNPVNMFYLTGFDGEGFCYISSEYGIIFTDSRYTVQAKNEAPMFEIREGGFDCLKDYIKEEEEVSVEAGSLSYNQYLKLSDPGFKLKDTWGIVEKQREIKDPEEIELICTATDILKETAEMFDTLVPGTSECQLANLIEFNMKSYNFTQIGFETIVAFGENAACPHHKPTDRILEKGEMVKIDYGVSYKHYNADVTRTVFVGKPDQKFKDIYNIVKDAKEEAVNAIKPGVSGKDIDKIARDYIAKYGYGDCFGHSLGHGIGLECHDSGSLSARSETILQPGYVTSVEPGIYIEGWGGIRLEDDVLVTKNGSLNLTREIRQ